MSEPILQNPNLIKVNAIQASLKITGWEPAEMDEAGEIGDIPCSRIRKTFTGGSEYPGMQVVEE